MSSEIVRGDRSPANPVPWKMVTKVGVATGRIGSKGEQEAAARTDQARQEAFAEGVATGRQQTEEQLRPAMEGLAQTLAELSRLREGIREQATQDLIRLAVSIAARVIHREVAVDPDALTGLVKAAFAKVQSREINRVRVHPAMEALLRKSLEQCGAPANLVLISDPSLKPGELFFETAQGILDASVETQLGEIERGLIDKLDR